MLLWLRSQYILAIIGSLLYFSRLASSKTYDKFYCSTEEGQHQLICPDDNALLTDVSILKVYRRTETCAPDVHSDYLAYCHGSIDGSICEGNKTCSIEVSTRNYVQCGQKNYAPTYFYVKYTCIQIHTMCTDTAPLRNTLYGFIVSPGYPHPMADNLKCSISIEADPSMYIELAPIQLRLQEATKCRSEYLEIFGYLDSTTSNSSNVETRLEKAGKDVWKSYYTWCGADRSTNHPPPNSRYLISSNSLYISLQTATSRKQRLFKLRYKVVPAIARAQYDLDGVAYDGGGAAQSFSSAITSSTTNTIGSTTIAVPTVDNSGQKDTNINQEKRPIKKEILIGIVSGIVVLILAIVIGVGIFLLKRRRTSTGNNMTKKPTPSASSPSNTNNNPPSKGTAKVADKAPLIEQGNTGTTNAAAKRKLVPERTVQLSDVNTSRFKSGTGTDGTGKGVTNGKETTSTSSDAAPSTTMKQPLTAADSGIYGADLSEEQTTVTKTAAPINSSPEKIYGLDLPDKSETKPPSPPISVVVNPLSEQDSTPTIEKKDIQSNILTDNHVSTTPLVESTPEDPARSFNINRFDDTVKSAYANLIDATISENEGNIASGSVTSSAAQSRRTSYTRQPLISHETNNIQGVTRKTPQFNPLHVILKKDANKYYTTEYI